MYKIIRFAGAILLTAVLLVIASRASRGKPEFVSHYDNGYKFEMTTVPKFAEHSRVRISLNITGPLSDEVQPVLRFAKSETDDLTAIDAYRIQPLIMADSTSGSYFAELSTGARGGRILYYVQVQDAKQQPLASFRMENGKPFFVKYFGDVPKVVLLPHIAFMFATVFCVAMAALHALSVIRGSEAPQEMLRYLLWSAVLTFIGGYPFGFAMNWYAFGGLWEGVPFGTDATDNKTQLLFVYQLFAVLIGLRSLTGGKMGRDIFSARTLGWYGLGMLAVMLFIYLIPHSIQFSKELTYAFCYGFIGFWALVYLYGWLRSRAAA
ncbi:MAG: hypothetical protein IPH75_00595 [bacterium]|nr:hypothetical protein [bacterium]